ADHTRVELRMRSSAPDGMDAIMVGGALLSLLLYLRGQTVLHASAIRLNGRSIAFMGRSGQGKSTLAALMCQAGAELITDDVVAVRSTAPPSIEVGTPEVRLRPTAAASLATSLSPGSPVDRSADSRDLVMLRDVTKADDDHGSPLAALVIPFPRRDAVLKVEQLSPTEALMSIVSNPHMPGWTDSAVLQRRFEIAAGLARTVPVFVGHVPWGPPFRDDIASAIWDAVDR